jgi:hypothetical protein
MAKAMIRFLVATSAILLVLGGFAMPMLTPSVEDPVDSPADREDREARMRLLMDLGTRRMQAVDDLLAGKATLQETARCFRDLAEKDPLDAAELLRLCHPAGVPQNELFYRQVIYYASARIHAQDLDTDIIADLEAELECLNVMDERALDSLQK